MNHSLARYATLGMISAMPISVAARAEPMIADQLASLEAYQQCLKETADIPRFFAYVDTSLEEWCGEYGQAREQWIHDESPTVFVHANRCEAFGISGESPDACLPVSFAGASMVQLVVDRAADSGLVQRVVDAIHARGVDNMIFKAAVPE